MIAYLTLDYLHFMVLGKSIYLLRSTQKMLRAYIYVKVTTMQAWRQIR